MSEWWWFAATPLGTASAPAKQANALSAARFLTVSPFAAAGGEDERWGASSPDVTLGLRQ
jgi:hypothetical protein